VKRIATTGISGFLGTHVRKALEQSGYSIENIPRGLRRSLADLRKHLENSPPAAIVHLAGIADVRVCREHPVEAFEAHVLETANLLEAARHVCPRAPLIYVATDKSFGEQESCTLTTPYVPSFPYETSKACEDLLIESYRKTYSVPVYLLRFPNFFGEGDHHVERLIPSICLAAVEKRELVIRTRLDGTIRQYIYVGDAADIVERTVAAALDRTGVWPLNHFGPPHLKTVGEVIRDVEAVMGESLNVRVLNQPGEVSRLSISDENFLGYAYTDWLPALERTVRWYWARAGNSKLTETTRSPVPTAPV